MSLFSDIQEQLANERRQARNTPNRAEAPQPPPCPMLHPPINPPASPAPELPQTTAVAAAVQRIKTDTERITRRNMKDSVAAYLAQSCATNADLARSVMAENKTMVRCFAYINRKAREYAEQERKDTGNTEVGIYGCDIPDDLVYGWAVAYFTDPDADKEPERKMPQKSPAKQKPKTEKKDATQPASGDGEQMSLMEGTT